MHCKLVGTRSFHNALSPKRCSSPLVGLLPACFSVRFVKAKQVLEIGAGYTSIFILQALADNRRELQAYAELQRRDLCTVGDGADRMPWCREGLLDEVVRAEKGPFELETACEAGCAGEGLHQGKDKGGGCGGVLHCVDNMAHAHTTAHRVAEAAAQLGVSRHLNLIERDAWDLTLRADGTHGSAKEMKMKTEDGEDEAPFLDLIWVDFGAGKHLEKFFRKWWPLLRPGG